jgi:RND family efflux transporter MFP subunit
MKKYLQSIVTFIKSHKIILGVGFLVLFLGLIIGLPRVKSALLPPEEKYETAKIKKEEIIQAISTSGEVEAENQVTLKFQTSGKLAWVGVKKGDKVKKWQAIASLDKYELQRTLTKALRDYSKERWNFEEDKDITYENQIITDTVKRILEKNQFDLEKAVIDVEIAHQAAKLATLVSPIEGIVTDIEAPVAGVNITPTTAEFTIIGPSVMKFVANVDELDIGNVKLGQKAIVALDAYPEEIFQGEVTKIAFSSITTRGGGTAFQVEISLGENINQQFKHGMNGDAEIIINQKQNALTVPLAAIKSDEGKYFIEVIENSKIKKIEVETDLESDTKTEIIGNIKEGQIVITGEKLKTEKKS